MELPGLDWMIICAFGVSDAPLWVQVKVGSGSPSAVHVRVAVVPAHYDGVLWMGEDRGRLWLGCVCVCVCIIHHNLVE